MSKRNLFTSNFKEIKELFLMCFLLIFTFAIFVLNIMPQYQNEYTAALLDKVNRLESINEPKIILLGNSNLSFGINSELLEERLGMPVVNMGLHGSLGNAFHENLAKFNICKGDIVIVAHTTFYDDGKLNDPVLGWITLENNWHLWKAVDFKMIKQLMDTFPTYLKRALTLWGTERGNLVPPGIYARQSFNEYGDIAVERKESKLDIEKTQIIMPAVNETASKRLNQLNEYIIDKGAVLLIAAYPILDGPATPDKQRYIQFQKELDSALEAPVISDYEEYFFDPEFFYDVNYHLTDEGALIRTEMLIKDILRWNMQRKFIDI